MEKLPTKIKERATTLRKLGYSIKEISVKLDIAKSTASIWTRAVKLNKKAQKRLEERKLIGYRKSALHWHKKLAIEKNRNLSISNKIVKNIRRDLFHSKLYCALLYWCEGGKGEKEGLKFSNSDPILVKTFLNLFRLSFPIDNKKLRVLMHLHGYHNEQKQRDFWSKITKIPQGQFYRTFLKLNTGKRIKKDYQGCITVYYNSRLIAREIRSIYEVFSR